MVALLLTDEDAGDPEGVLIAPGCLDARWLVTPEPVVDPGGRPRRFFGVPAEAEGLAVSDISESFKKIKLQRKNSFFKQTLKIANYQDSFSKQTPQG